MRVPAATLAIVVLLLMCSTVSAGQTAQGAVRGEVTDNSGGVLPGVTVVATAANGGILATTVTDGSGRYTFRALRPGPITLTFELEGFASAIVEAVVKAGAESRVVQRLDLASLSQTVVVSAAAPVDPPRPVAPPPPPLPPLIPVPEHDRDSICGPSKPAAAPESLGTIRSARDGTARGLFETGSALVIDGGLDRGLEVGRNLVVRRHYHVRGISSDTVGEHSAGLLQIVEAGERSSLGVVVYACGELGQGDFLAAFNPEPIRAPEPMGFPAFYDASQILFADEGQTLGAPRRLMVIDRGLNRGTRVGERLTVFRRGLGSDKHEVVGDAVVVAVRIDSATIRIDRVTDAISAGDWVAPQTTSPVVPRHR